MSKLIRLPEKMNQEPYEQLINDSYRSDHALIMGSMFADIMESRKLEVTKEQARFIMATLKLWSTKEDIDRPIVVNAPCGYGKSTMLEVFATYMSRTHDRFGCIIVKPLLKEVRKTVEAINTTVGYKVAFGLAGANSFATKEEYQQQWEDQVKYPILVITQEMFARKANARNLESISTFYDSEGRKSKREQLIVDEKPKLIQKSVLSERTLLELYLDIKKVAGRSSGVVQKFEVVYEQLRRKLTKHAQQFSKLEPIQPSFFIPKKLKLAWEQKYEGNNFDLLYAFEQVIKKGGILQTNQHGETYVDHSQRAYFEWSQFNSFILDGTAKLDYDYGTYADDFLIMQPQEKKSYKHVTFKLGDETTMSRTFFKDSKNAFERVVDMLKTDILPKHKQVMIVVYKADLEKYQEALADYSHKIMWKHFDNGRSSNEYAHCDAGVFLGWLIKPANHYLGQTQAITGETPDTGFNSHKTKGYELADPRAEEIKLAELIVERIQDIERVRLGATDTPKTIYMFHKDVDMLQEITKHFPQSNVEWFKTNLTDKKQTAESKLVEFFMGMSEGQEVKGKFIYEEVLGVDRKTLQRLLKQPRVQQIMLELGISKVGQKFVKQ
ncbi:hypothetical protein J2Y03_001198 [Neobacillus niacini]|uniref:DEAD/DEAH box helicase family protein n=1 Tax=Neobacillus niacini TaxID=86668 RepID=UPI00285EAADC|nr:DEAD/DEAH box helicase family protein [Neobacillus niacini]MDR7076195.1 hypothetical protein [Neobacillus niacini]